MGTAVAKRKVEKRKDAEEAMSIAIADFMWGHRAAEMIPDRALVTRLREYTGKQLQLTYAQLGKLVSVARVLIEQKHPGYTIIRLRKMGYKLSNDTEYAEFTMGWAKRTFNAAARTMELAPNMKRECVGPAVRKVFGDNEAELKRLAKAKVEFGAQVSTWRKGNENGKAKQIEDKR